MSTRDQPASTRHPAIERLVSLPPAVSRRFASLLAGRFPGTFVASDPEGTQLGSGGGTAYLLTAGWQADPDPASFADWMGRGVKLIIHGSGQSRRLPAYAAPGKPLIPLPAFKNSRAQRPDQYLLDLQSGAYEALLRHAPPGYRLMIACGDVYIHHHHWLPAFPVADVLIVGLTASPEEASHHGVMLTERDTPTVLDCFLQKPEPERIRSLAGTHTFSLDTGIWLLSARAVDVLMHKCGWDPGTQRFTGDLPGTYDLFATFGPALGTRPHAADPDVSVLSAAVLPLTDARFYHFGTNRSLMASVLELQSPSFAQRSFGHASLEPPVAPIVLHADVACDIDDTHRHIWIENADIPATWTLTERHVLTGIPPNTWTLSLAPGRCIDCVPVDGSAIAVRCYGFDDAFRGTMASPDTRWLDAPAGAWFERRGITLAEAGIDPAADIQDAPLFPVQPAGEIDEAFMTWMLAAEPPPDDALRRRWLEAPRRSACGLLVDTDMEAVIRRRHGHVTRHWATLSADGWLAACSATDLAAVADLCERDGLDIPDLSYTEQPGLDLMHDRMWRAAMARRRGDDAADDLERQAFECLRRMIVRDMERDPVRPCRNVLDDQIVWGRAPVRLDLAGGWTDTPPYCIEHGGQVVNLAVDLNGQPPIHVFARVSETPHIVLRSIDLGIDQVITGYEDLRAYTRLGSGFAIARAALALAGLEPRFHAGPGYPSLAAQLDEEFGGGIELSMVCAIPKGSGLGTSSILAASLLGTLSELCGLRWNQGAIFRRTMALEQMLTSGGGWQDQVGGVAPALKLAETVPGLVQEPIIRELPTSLFTGSDTAACLLLYYTGITRVAHDILGEIVRGFFLNSSTHLGINREIGQNALYAADAIQRGSWDDLCEAVRRSWRLKQLIDSGTNPPPVQAILDTADDYLDACTLLGAGGGGYLLMLAKDEAAAQAIRKALQETPPNSRARFVEPGISTTGFQVTRS